MHIQTTCTICVYVRWIETDYFINHLTIGKPSREVILSEMNKQQHTPPNVVASTCRTLTIQLEVNNKLNKHRNCTEVTLPQVPSKCHTSSLRCTCAVLLSNFLLYNNTWTYGQMDRQKIAIKWLHALILHLRFAVRVNNSKCSTVEPLYNGHHWDQRFCPL